MTKYMKYRKSLDSKSKTKKEKMASSSDQASLSSSKDSDVSLASAASAARVTELISSQLGQFNASFATSMQASFDILGPLLMRDLLVRIFSQN